MIGTIGQLLILTAFVACGLAGFAFLRASQLLHDAHTDWKRIGRAAWSVMLVSVLISMGLLIFLILTHQYQYAYVYKYSSNDLPIFYLISSSWAGQEGSFLLWIILNGLFGVGLIRWAKNFEAPVLAIMSLCQFFLISMIVGLKISSLGIGASPFVSLAEEFPDAPMIQAGLIPSDGQGLNDLLQNYWMVIHPPMLFTGFAAMLVPFSFAVTALWKKHYTSWVRPALPWALFAVMILGFAIALGGYWAYVTLSFGGYWAWDPVENSSLVPWLIGIAALHMMIVQKKSGSSHKAAIALNIFAYMMVIYSTFLTRSGILGDTSVHAFVDLDLYSQLLLWIAVMGGLGFGLFAYRYRELPVPDHNADLLSREFMIFSGAVLLCAVATVILMGTSAPILGRLFRDSPSTVPISFYNKWTLPLTVGLVFLAGLGQLFWWNKMSVESVNRVLLKPIVLSVVSTLLVLLFTPFVEQTARPATEVKLATVQAGFFGGIESFFSIYGVGLMMLLLVFVAFFSLYGNGFVIWRIGRGNPRLAGGALAHVGFAIMLLGVVASSGFSTTLGTDPSGQGRNNFVVDRGQTVLVDDYRVTYADMKPNDIGRPVYQLDFVDPNGQSFSVHPVVYKSNKNQWIQNPDVKLGLFRDLFVAVTPNKMFQNDQEANTISLGRGDSTRLGGDKFEVTFVDFELNQDPRVMTDTTHLAVTAVLRVRNLKSGGLRILKPVYHLEPGTGVVNLEPAVAKEWGLTITFQRMDVESKKIELGIEGAAIAPEDWLVVQAYEKPLIDLVWLGIILFTIGFGISLFRRAKDYRNSLSRA